jgi:hypothetical protein
MELISVIIFSLFTRLLNTDILLGKWFIQNSDEDELQNFTFRFA